MDRVIDVHVHLAALPTEDNGCLIASHLMKGFLFRSLMRRLDLPEGDPKRTNAVYLDRLITTLGQSQFVKGAVILGMDGIYGPDGTLDRAETHFLIPNDVVLKAVAGHPEILRAGISINPQRRDALEELGRCASQGVALVKLLPNAQRFDPSHKKYLPFYEQLKKYKIPLLTHIGYEYSLVGHDQSMGNLSHWETALEAGVTVIAAHGASSGLFLWESHWELLQEYVRRYPHFYWDASALSLPNRVGMLLRLRRKPELAARMIFGTDYPLPSFAYPPLLRGDWGRYRELHEIKNPFDRHFRLLELFNLPPTPRLFS